MIAVTTPNGNVGKDVLSGLIAAGEPVRAVSYRPDRLRAELWEKCEVVAGPLDDTGTLERAFMGAKSLFWCVPQSHHWEKASDYYGAFTEAACAGLRAAGPSPPRLVGVSGGGCGVPDGGILAALGSMEGRLNAEGGATRLLRCGYFMENLFWSVESIKAAGAVFLPPPADLPLPMVAAKDIADVAVRWLQDPEWSDQQPPAVYGPADVTPEGMVHILSEVMERSIRYVEVGGSAMKETLRRYGASEGFAEAYMRMCSAFAEGSYSREPRTPEATTPTTLREWSAQNLAPALKGTL